jgi:hypothetical protein
MSDTTHAIGTDNEGDRAARLAARRNAKAANADATAEAMPTVERAVKPITEGMSDRLAARRAKAESDGATQAGDGEGRQSQTVAREPLFVGLGIRGHHNAGQLDRDAPAASVARNPMDRPREKLGAPDPQPERTRKHKP